MRMRATRYSQPRFGRGVNVDGVARWTTCFVVSPPRTNGISLLTAICIVIANMIGTGVFTSLGFQVGDLPSGFAIVTLWTVGGVCALCGALSYAELGAA